ncbi:MAG: hypothetical protein JW967_01235 [Dehalococcoidales bacterium]|nr:hypothetical protein [Dehalococcoidales bacterium]
MTREVEVKAVNPGAFGGVLMRGELLPSTLVSPPHSGGKSYRFKPITLWLTAPVEFTTHIGGISKALWLRILY